MTGESPFLLMFGYQLQLPINVCFGINPKWYNSKTHSHYVNELKRKLRYAYQLAIQNAEKRHLMNKARWDKKVTAAAVDVGNRVLVKNVNIRRKHNRWESTACVVTKQLNSEITVNVIWPENGDGPERILHRDILLPCRFLPASPSEDDDVATVAKTRACRVRKSDLEVERFGEIVDAESPHKSLNPHVPEFQLGTESQNVPDSSLTHSVSNVQKVEINPGDLLRDELVESEIEGGCETEIQQDVSSLVEDGADEFVQHELSAEERHDSLVGLRRSQREKRPPSKLKDYVGWKAQCVRQSVNVESQPNYFSQVLKMMQQQIKVKQTQGELLFSLMGHVSN